MEYVILILKLFHYHYFEEVLFGNMRKTDPVNTVINDQTQAHSRKHWKTITVMTKTRQKAAGFCTNGSNEARRYWFWYCSHNYEDEYLTDTLIGQLNLTPIEAIRLRTVLKCCTFKCNWTKKRICSRNFTS